MPLLKKVMDLNGSTVVVLPKQWTDAFERLNGIKLTEILMDVNEEIRIKPFIPSESPKEHSKKEESESIFEE